MLYTPRAWYFSTIIGAILVKLQRVHSDGAFSEGALVDANRIVSPLRRPAFSVLSLILFAAFS